MKRASALVLAAALALAPGAGSAQSARASETKLTPIIAELLAQPSAFVGKSVTIYGLVIEANAARTKFMLQDVSQQPLPILGNERLKAKAGDQVIVTGTVHVRGKDVGAAAAEARAIQLLRMPHDSYGGKSGRSYVKPNIVFILLDNLGYGELGCYGGGIVRGTPTPRADQLAAEGMRLTNFNVEAQCTPSRSAIMTGRYAMRSGTLTVPIGNPAVADPRTQGLTQWEITIAKLLSEAGYKTAHFGKWHLGSMDGRFPNDQGFDEWWGIPRTTDEVFWPGDPGFEKSGVQPQYIMEGRKGELSRKLKIYDLKQRPFLDAEITRRAMEFMKQSVAQKRPFYAYLPMTQVHLPSTPHPEFAGRTGLGDFADAVVETDHRLGQILDAIDVLGIRDETIVVFTSDNGPDPTWPWQGSSGPWRGYYFTHMEGSLRVPFLIRWPGKIPAGSVSNETVHQVDTFTTFLKLAGVNIPTDRAIDGVDQTDFFLGKQNNSNRESVLAFVAERLEAVKWRDWKLVFYEETRDWFGTPQKLTLPKLFNLANDPKEEYPETTLRNTWAMVKCLEVIKQFNKSLKKYPAVPEGTRDPYVPPQMGAT